MFTHETRRKLYKFENQAKLLAQVAHNIGVRHKIQHTAVRTLRSREPRS